MLIVIAIMIMMIMNIIEMLIIIMIVSILRYRYLFIVHQSSARSRPDKWGCVKLKPRLRMRSVRRRCTKRSGFEAVFTKETVAKVV